MSSSEWGCDVLHEGRGAHAPCCLVTSYTRAFNDSLVQTSKELTRQVRTLATRAGWPDGVCDALSVVYRGGAFAVTYPETLQATIDILETGTQDKPPTAVLRRFENAVVRKGGDVLMHFLAQDLAKAKAI